MQTQDNLTKRKSYNKKVTKEFTCYQCETKFTCEVWNSVKKKYCSKDCRNIYLQKTSSNPNKSIVGAANAVFRYWTNAEDETLRELSKSFHVTQIIDMWNDIADKNNWLYRNGAGIRQRIFRLGLSNQSEDDNFIPKRLAKILDINKCRISDWIETNKLETINYCYSQSGNYQVRLISKKLFKEFAITHPNSLWDISVNNLDKLLNDRNLSKEIVEIASLSKPKSGVKFTVVRLTIGGHKPLVYKSSYTAALDLRCTINAISKNLKRDTPTEKHGHFVKLDYPVYLVPLQYRNEFNQLAGKLLIRIFEDLSKIQGYRKTICIVVAVRQAVQIALMTFRREHRLLLDNKTFDDKEAYSEYWIEKFYTLYNFHANVRDSQKSITKIKSTLRFFVYPMFVAKYKSKASFHFDEYSANLIAKWSNTYYSRSVLPYNYKPQSRFEYGDIFTYVNGLATATVTLPDKSRFRLAALETFHYFKKHPTETELNNEWLAHNETQETNHDCSQELQEIIDNLSSLNISNDLLNDTIKFVEIFMQTNDFEVTRNKLNISYGQQQEILETLKKSSLPF